MFFASLRLPVFKQQIPRMLRRMITPLLGCLVESLDDLFILKGIDFCGNLCRLAHF